jgi:hypothetical protein
MTTRMKMDGATATLLRDAELSAMGITTQRGSRNYGDGYERSSKLATMSVRLSSFASESLREFDYGTGYEVAGLLTGEIVGDEIVIHDAFQTAPGEHRGHVAIDLDGIWEHDVRASRANWRIVGSVHSHEYFDDLGVRASGADRSFWARVTRRLNIPHVGLIVAPRTPTEFASAWAYPLFGCWLASERDFKVTIQPARLTVET